MEELKINYSLEIKPFGRYEVTDKIECVVETKEDWKFEKYGEYNIQSLERYYEFLKGSERAKDKERVALVEKYVKEKKG